MCWRGETPSECLKHCVKGQEYPSADELESIRTVQHIQFLIQHGFCRVQILHHLAAVKVVPRSINHHNLCLSSVLVFCEWAEFPDVLFTCPVPGRRWLHLLVRWRGVVGALAGQQGVLTAVCPKCLMAAGRLLGQQELGRPGCRGGGETLSPAAIHRLLIGGEGDGKSIHHQVQLVWGATAAGKRRVTVNKESRSW